LVAITACLTKLTRAEDPTAAVLHVGTIGGLIDFALMNEPVSLLIESSMEIRVGLPGAHGRIEDTTVASRVLLHAVETMVFRGEQRRLFLANKAIFEYQKFIADQEAV
jgi:hypothetical protein